MQSSQVTLLEEDDCQALESLLVDRIYEFNSQATGHFDGKLLGGKILDEQGKVIAGFCGHTWGGSCQLTNMWVSEQHRGQGLGKALLQSAEAEASRRGSRQVVLLTHSFQAPGFYEANRYVRKYAIQDVPVGHADFVYVKVLREAPGDSEASDRGN